jgi:hypothetical protein
VSQTPKRRRAARRQDPRSETAAAASVPVSADVADADAVAAAEGSAGAAGPPPLRLSFAAAVAGLEGLAVAVWGVTMFFTGGGRAVLAGFLVLLLAALPLGAAYGLRRARRWSRGPALVMQLLCLPIAWTMLRSEGAVIVGGAVLGVLALAGLVLLVHPATTDALGIRRAASS